MDYEEHPHAGKEDSGQLEHLTAAIVGDVFTFQVNRPWVLKEIL